MCLEGECEITDENNHKSNIKRGETLLIPAKLKNVNIELISAEVKLLEIFLP